MSGHSKWSTIKHKKGALDAVHLSIRQGQKKASREGGLVKIKVPATSYSSTPLPAQYHRR